LIYGIFRGMSEISSFNPPKRSGQLFLTGMILLSFSIGSLSLWGALNMGMSPITIVYVILSLFSFLAIPLFFYRIYALRNATYSLEREGIYIRWGLRIEDIPMQSVEWVAHASELNTKLPLPWLTLPGAVLGVRKFPDGTQIEYLASKTKNLVLIKSNGAIFGISPNDVSGFLNTYQRIIEMGTISQIEARSIHPSFIFSRIWNDRFARTLFLLSFFFSAALWVFASFVISNYDQIRLGYSPSDSSINLVPSSNVILIPLLNTFFVLMNFFAGLYFFRVKASMPYAYLLWICGVILPILNAIGIIFMIQ